jgi:LysR family glycine cleavage system transcriptional activator
LAEPRGRRLPPFFALRALEAAARRRSYTRAAEELAVTHGAVSQQIRRLEADLGAKLFERRGNLMLPTPAALRLASRIAQSIDLLQEGVSEFIDGPEREPLVVSVDTQFAGRWLPARLPRLLAHPAGANLEVRVEDRCADFVTDGVDLGIRYGEGGWEGLEIEPLLAETLYPVCTPELARRLRLRDSRDLAQAPLLHHSHRGWPMWFEAHGLGAPPPQGLVFEDSLMLIEAAAQGLGVALARSTLVVGELEAGRLMRPIAGEVANPAGFSLAWRADSRKLRRIHALRDWLVAEARPDDTATNRAA